MNELIDKTFTIDSQKIEQDSKRVVNSILEMNSTKGLLIKTLQSQVTELKKILIQLENNVNWLDGKKQLLEPGQEYDVLESKLAEAKQLLEQEKKAFADIESQLNIAAAFICQLDGFQEILNTNMGRIKSADQKDSVQYKTITKLAGEMEKKLRELKMVTNN